LLDKQGGKVKNLPGLLGWRGNPERSADEMGVYRGVFAAP
jgi:hypothetical protein